MGIVVDTAASTEAITSTATTTATSRPMGEGRAAMEGIPAQYMQHNKIRNDTVTKAEMEKCRKKNIPWD